MKFHAAFILLGGLFLLTSLGSAVPNIQSTTPENKVCPSYVCSGPIVRPISQNGACFCPLTLSKNVDTSHDAAFEILRRQSPPQPPATLLPILNLATNLWAIQTVGALTDPLQFTFLCSNFSLARLALEGYNTTSLSRTFCSAASSFGSGSSSSSTPTFPALDLINQLTIQYSTQIWITQAVGALSCNSTKGHGNEKRPNGQKAATLCQNKKLATLCHMLDVAGADAVGLDGTAVKNQICAAAEGHPVDVLPVPVF